MNCKYFDHLLNQSIIIREGKLIEVSFEEEVVDSLINLLKGSFLSLLQLIDPEKKLQTTASIDGLAIIIDLIPKKVAII